MFFSLSKSSQLSIVSSHFAIDIKLLFKLRRRLSLSEFLYRTILTNLV